MRKEALVVLVLALVLAFAQGAIGQEEVTVPFSAIKSSCYGEIDMSKAEFQLSEVGEECVSQDWLEENKPAEEKKESTEKPELKEAQIKPDNPPKVFTVPRSAVMEEGLNQLSEDRKEKEKIEISVNWVKNSWLAENKPELALQAVDSLLSWGKQPTIEEVVKVINTPRQLQKFMGAYFTISSDFEEPRESVIAFTPSKMLETKKGACNDWAAFSSYILRWNGYKAYKLVRPLHPMQDGHILTVWEDHEGRYNLLNYTDMYLNIGKTVKQVVTFLERNPNYEQSADKNYNEIYAYSLLDPLELNIRKGVAPALTEKILETVPYAHNFDLNLKAKENSLHRLWGRIVQIEKADSRKHKITFLVDLRQMFKNSPRTFLLVDLVTTAATNYLKQYPSPGTDIREKSTFEKAIYPAEKALITIKEKITSIDSINHPLTVNKIIAF